ncbi:alpha/beta hydrolase [Halostagnicola kamekurae]|uniref:Phospholipase/carboxylesterase n=1 Tax=Halostagnicola kamekurae TaxID=619731 RepID=A0A1I6SHN1_9EURY|nr:alpha/beta fold hydrolase [Halostagnicola kamekurae]SFS76437.1 phospholipase/carboxylesterase [Halostagnicola kamekurae]
MIDDPHGNQPIERVGADLEDAAAAMVLVHGRGARASGMLEFANEFARDDVAFLAPQAHRGTWYPNSFLAPIEDNQPHLDSALAKLEDVLETVESAGIPLERTILLGFSQGGCLSTEYAARNADRYGGVVALSGGLIGPEGTPRDYDGSMDGTAVFIGCGDQDPHIPVERVDESIRAFDDLEAETEKRIYQGVGHTVLEDELEYVRELVDGVAE